MQAPGGDETPSTKARPDREAAFQRGIRGPRDGDLRDLDQRLTAAATAIGDTPLLFSHPVYQYLIRGYGLNGSLGALGAGPSRLPKRCGSELEELTADPPGARWMVWEGEPAEATVRQLEAMGIGSVVYAPCGSTPGEGDFLSVMRANATALDRLLR